MAETFSSSGEWAEAERERLQTVTLIHSQGPQRLQYPGLSLVRVAARRPLIGQIWPRVISGPQPGPGRVLHTGPSVHALLEPSLTSEGTQTRRPQDIRAAQLSMNDDSISYFTISIFSFHVTIINFTRFPLK